MNTKIIAVKQLAQVKEPVIQRVELATSPICTDETDKGEV